MYAQCHNSFRTTARGVNELYDCAERMDLLTEPNLRRAPGRTTNKDDVNLGRC
jgi:hypothetical protein